MTHHRDPYSHTKHNEFKILVVRSLTTADLAALRQPRAVTPIKKLRERHHHMAFLLAIGKSLSEIAVECRVSPNRVSALQHTPAFAELIARYRAQIEEQRLATLSDYGALASDTMLHGERVNNAYVRRIAADPDSATLADVRLTNRITVDRMDRFGYGKHTTSESRNVNLNFATNLEAAIARARKVA